MTSLERRILALLVLLALPGGFAAAIPFGDAGAARSTASASAAPRGGADAGPREVLRPSSAAEAPPVGREAKALSSAAAPSSAKGGGPQPWNSVALFLATIAGIFLLGAFGEVVFARTNVPDVIWLIIAGILIGPVAGIVTRVQLLAIAPYFAALTLVVVLFEGGSRLNLSALSTAAPRSALLALLTFVSAVAVVAVISMGLSAIGWLPAVWTWKHGLLLGSILGGSSSIIIMPAMSQAKVESRVANLINLESALTDAFCVVSATALINLMVGGAEGGSAATALANSFGIGLAMGGASGLLWLLLLGPLSKSEHAYPITLSALFLLYVLIERAGGSAALGVLAFAIIVGNAIGITTKIGLARAVELRPDTRGFHSQMAFIIKSFFFTFIGAMLSPPWSLIAMGGLLGGVLLVARIPGAWLATLGSGLSRAQRKLVIVSMPRGMAAGVLATLPAAAGVPGTDQLPVVVFAGVLTTILVFAIGFPLARQSAAAPVPAAENAPASPAPPLASAKAGLPVSSPDDEAAADRVE
ncbi:MAG: cation:proton antiporter [Proteobacteria bacterium]|nr:cation:proton antiporter [Pseudomonadota bacterium]